MQFLSTRCISNSTRFSRNSIDLATLTDHLTQLDGLLPSSPFATRLRYIVAYIKFRTEKESSTDSHPYIESAGFTLTRDDRLRVYGNGRSISYLKQKERRRLSSDITPHERFNYAGR